MVASNIRNPRDKGLALYRRAKFLYVTPGHLSRVISGNRESASLLRRLEKLMESEPVTKKKTTKPQH